MPVQAVRASRGSRGRHVLLAILVAVLGFVNAALALVENPAADYAGFGIRNWIFLLLLPFLIGVIAPLAFWCSRSLDEDDFKGRVLRLAMGAATVLCLTVGLSDLMFVVENQNNLFMGMFCIGFGGGWLAIAASASVSPRRTPQDGPSAPPSHPQPVMRSGVGSSRREASRGSTRPA